MRHVNLGEGADTLAPKPLGPREIMGILRRRKLMILSVVLAGTAVALAAAYALPRVYTATSMVLLEKDDPNLLEEQPDAPAQQPNKSKMDTETDQMTSRNFVRTVVDDQHLLDDPLFNTYLKPQSFSLFDWLQAMLKISKDDQAAVVPMDVQRDQAITGLLSNMAVTRNGDSTAMSIAVTADKPAKAASLANSIASLYVARSSELKLGATRQATDFLRQQSNSLASNIADREKEIASYGSDKDVWADPSDDLLRQAMQQTNEQLSQARADLAKARSLLAQVKEDASGNETFNDPILASSFLTTLRGQEADVLKQRSELARNFGSGHPQILALDAQIGSVKASIIREIGRIAFGLRNDVNVAEGRVNSLENQLQTANGGLRARAPSEIRLRELNRDLLTEQKLYDVVYSRLGKLDPYSEIASPGARVISFAATPTSPSFPKVKLLILGGITASFVFAFIAAMTMESFDTAVVDQRRVARILRTAVLASIPKKHGKVLLRGGKSLLRPVMRHADKSGVSRLQTLWSLCRRRTASFSHVSLLVTSAQISSARPAISLGLARAAASSGEKTLLFDFDAGNYSLQKIIAKRSNVRFAQEFLKGECALDDILHPVATIAGLSYVYIAKGSGPSTSVLSPAQFGELLNVFRSKFDIVIVDAPPLMVAEETLAAAGLADAVLLTLTSGITRESTLSEISQRFRFHDIPLIGAVLNDSDDDLSVFMTMPDAAASRANHVYS